MFCEFEVNKNLSGASAVWGVFTVGKPKPDRDCLHMHFHCETAVAQHAAACDDAPHSGYVYACAEALTYPSRGYPKRAQP